MAKSVKLQEVTIDLLKPYERNAKIHPQQQVEKIIESIKEFGFVTPCVIDQDYNLIAGHGRVLAAKEMGLETVPCVFIEGLTEEQRRAYILADNRLSEIAEWNDELLAFELHELEVEGFDVGTIGFNFEAGKKEKTEAEKEHAYETLSSRFIIPPFSILDSRQKAWLDRKRAWKNLGIDSLKGRGNDGDGAQDGLTFAKSHVPISMYHKKNRLEESLGREISWDEYYEVFPNDNQSGNTSAFDPVLTELGCRWYSKEGDRIIDPFSGGSVRGIVSALLGRKYTGIDLSSRQIEANKENWKEITHLTLRDQQEAPEPKWIIGDSLNINELVPEDNFDLLLTCPPYADLEVYSDDPRDLSNMDYSEFCKVYEEIIKRSVAKLKPNAFAFVVVGDIRDKDGYYRDFVSFTIKAFAKAGMKLYNEGIFITPVGMVAVAVNRQFSVSRKTGKVHQNVLIFADDRGELTSLSLDDTEEEEKQIQGFIDEHEGKITRNFQKVLTFTNGDPRKSVEDLGDVENDDYLFNVEI